MIKKFRFILTIILFIILGIQLKVNAFEMLPNLENQDLVTKEFEVTLKLTDLAEYENGINVVSGKLVYDADIFESITFSGINGWTCAYNDQENTGNEGKFVLITTSGNLKEEKDVAQINVKVKENLKNINTTIKFESVETSYQSKAIKTEDKEIPIEIKDNKVSLKEIKEVNTATSKNIDNNINENQNVKETQNYNIYVIIGIVVILIMFLIFIIKIIKKGGKSNEK